MSPSSARDLLSGRRRGPLAALARAGLLALTPLYRLALVLRELAYAVGLRRVGRPSVPVISVGNLTAGGTGKSPFVAWVVRHLAGRGIRAAVVSRGYGATAGEMGDEGRALLEADPGILRVEDPDRVRGSAEAVSRGAEVVVLDDAFQHRACARDLDVVLVDATEPFGYGHLLPRGLLREPLSALRRADVLVLTRVDQAGDAAADALESRLGTLAPGVPVVRARHAPVSLRPLGKGEAGAPEDLEGRPVLALCGLGHPEAFERTLRDLGARVVDAVRFPDHHPYVAADLAAARERGRAAGAEIVVTTTKDAVKLRELPGAGEAPPVRVLDVAIEIVAGEEVLADRIVAATASIRSND